jgi:hypothetical protein
MEDSARNATLIEDIFTIRWNMKQERVTPIQARALVQLAIMDHLKGNDPYATEPLRPTLDIIIPESKEVADVT